MRKRMVSSSKGLMAKASFRYRCDMTLPVFMTCYVVRRISWKSAVSTLQQNTKEQSIASSLTTDVNKLALPTNLHNYPLSLLPQFPRGGKGIAPVVCRGWHHPLRGWHTGTCSRL